MQEVDPIIGITILLAAALAGGMIAHRLRQPIILGYLAVGILVGPYGLGVVDDLALIETAATIGVALLMFTLGLEISLAQLKEVGKVGIWGGVAQILVTFMLGTVVGFALFRWSLPQSFLFGLIISLSSTAVCLKLLMERGELTSVHGRIMIAILILQDISVVLMVIIMPIIGGTAQNVFLAIGLALGKAVLFIGIALVSGIWVLPWLIGRIGGVRSRELFLLTVLVLCLGAAIGTQIFGLSMVFGAFLVGIVIRGPKFGYQALAEITPLRDIFATLFFVSLGMLLDTRFILENWPLVIISVVVIILLKSGVIFGIVRLFRHSTRIAVISGVGLFQIGEFSFILAQGGLDSGILSSEFHSLILASAVITMLLTPLSLGLAARLHRRVRPAERKEVIDMPDTVSIPVPEPGPTDDRVIVAGYGRIGQNLAQGLHDAGVYYVVIDIDPERISDAKKSGIPRIYGDASNEHVLSKAGLNKVKTLVVTFPDPVAVLNTVKTAREINPRLNIIARVHRVREANILRNIGISELISPEYEASLEFLRRTLAVSGWKKSEIMRTLPIVEQDKDFVEFSEEEEM